MPPLRLHPTDPRYFADAAGRRVILAGSHHWDNLLDNAERPGGFDFERYLDRLAGWGHNFIRLWTHEAWTHDLRPRVYCREERTGPGPGRALDGRPRFDLTRFNPEYFDRLRGRVVRAGERGFYVSVMLFNGWSIHNKGEGNPWDHHPFNRENNIHRIDGDPDARGEGSDVHTLRVPEITRLQEAYVEKVVETVGDLDHVLWEISNESPRESVPWQYNLIDFLKKVDPNRHPIGMTATFPGNRNEDLFRGPADWISPGNQGGWRKNPPPADGRKVVIVDTDHLWGIGGNADWVRRMFGLGYQVLYMDLLDEDPVREGARRAIGEALRNLRAV